jgi:hypothetical protein
LWYLAELLFAEPPHPEKSDCQCEASNVVFEAPDATEAFRKAISWGLAYAAEPPSGLRFLGVSHLTTVGEKLGDGTEICGRFYRSEDIWNQIADMVPPPGRLKAILWEQGREVPLEALLTPEHVALLKRVCEEAGG